MNSYERVMAALNLKIPDRVPIGELIIDPKVFKALVPNAEDQGDFEEAFELDTVRCGDCYDRIWEDDNYFKDEWGVLYKKGGVEVAFHPVDHPIKDIKDFDNYPLPDPDKPGRLGKLPMLVQKYKGKKAIIFQQRAEFMWSVYLRGMDNLLMDFILEPEFAHRLLDRVLETNIRLAQNACRAGADIIVLGDDVAANSGPLMSPQLFDEFIAPRMKKIVDAIHAEGAKVIKHTDGNIMKIIDSIINTGIDGLNPIDPIAGMDIREIKEKYGHKVCLVGNIDCGPLLTFGTPEDVEKTVKETIEIAAPGGGFILTSSNSIHSSVKPENYKAMIEAARKYGNCY